MTLTRVIPFQVPSGPIMEVCGLPKWVVARIKRATFDLELITKNEVVLVPVETGARSSASWSVLVDETGKIGKVRDLAGSINTSQIVSASVNRSLVEFEDDGVAAEKDDEAATDEKNHSHIHPASSAKKVPLAVQLAKSCGRWIVELIVEFWVLCIV